MRHWCQTMSNFFLSTVPSVSKQKAYPPKHCTLHKKLKFSIMDFFSKCDKIRSFLQICSHLLKKSLMKNFIFCAPLRILLVNCWTIAIWAEHKFFSLAIHRWMLIITHPFLTQPSTSLYPPSHCKSHFFKLSIFPSVQLPEFIL